MVRNTLVIITCLVLMPVLSSAQNCAIQEAPDSKYEATNKYASFEVNWYPEWLEYTGGVISHQQVARTH